ncbi:hypothetical protein F5883DRAFT_66823 [Diaporthe sp. PMI_573]|nr:hypothetical protein F5883DRAFT_66823 [Diaporthaceae sp. PMI_573]
MSRAFLLFLCHIFVSKFLKPKLEGMVDCSIQWLSNMFIRTILFAGPEGSYNALSACQILRPDVVVSIDIRTAADIVSRSFQLRVESSCSSRISCWRGIPIGIPPDWRTDVHVDAHDGYMLTPERWCSLGILKLGHFTSVTAAMVGKPPGRHKDPNP